MIAIQTLAPIHGSLPRRAMALVLEWAAIHREELKSDGERARRGVPPFPIAPLD